MTAQEARDITANSHEGSRLIAEIENGIKVNALQGQRFIVVEGGPESSLSKLLNVCYHFKSIEYDVHVHRHKISNASLIFISW